jgi:glyoxylase-like metal-dependent hydrolase (beta-lactamase superfamily II)
MVVRELAPGLWRWTALHPAWTPEWSRRQAEEGQGWEQEVGCIYLETAGHVLLFDPLIPGEPEARATFLRNLDDDVRRKSKPVAILLTISEHERSCAELARRYGASIWGRVGAADRVEAPVSNQFVPGDVLPGGVIGIDAQRAFETIYWLPEQRALVPGDALLGDGKGGVSITPESWLPNTPPRDFKRSLRGLLDLPVEMVLVSHGEPVLRNGHAALERALAD